MNTFRIREQSTHDLGFEVGKSLHLPDMPQKLRYGCLISLLWKKLIRKIGVRRQGHSTTT